jgi:hypothetical protein
MASSGMLRRVAVVSTDVSEVLSASFIRVTRIGELGTTLAVISNRRTLRRNTVGSSETSVLTRATRRNILEDTILQYQSSLYLCFGFNLHSGDNGPNFILIYVFVCVWECALRLTETGTTLTAGSHAPLDCLHSVI